jgi:putative DNA primase/helicase
LNGKQYPAGLYWHTVKNPGEENETHIDQRVGAPIHADALTHDEHGSNHGVLLRFVDPQGRWKSLAVPMAPMATGGDEILKELLRNGYRHEPRHKRLLQDWMTSRYPEDQITAATCTGWSLEEDAFVLPTLTIGNPAIRFQSEYAAPDTYRTAGTLESWRESVAGLCAGNPVPLLAVSTAFAGPLLLKAKRQHAGGGGIHFVGVSGCGKTGAGLMAASVWGGPDYLTTWNATGNGLEATAAARNDTLLPLDEIGESNAFEIGEIIYALANGHGKQRAARTGGARLSARWRIITLSTGEHTVETQIKKAGGKIKAGQEARLLDIRVDNRAFGTYDNLHGYPDGAALNSAIKERASRDYGHAGPAFVEALLKDTEDRTGQYNDLCSLPHFSADDGVEARAAGTFALIAMAGELATEYGITGWREDDAINAAVEMYQGWKASRGKGHTETRQILEAVTAFIEAHGDSRFSEIHPSTTEPVRASGQGRAGYWEDTNEGRVFLFTTAALEEAAKGFDKRRIAETLDNAGWLIEKDTNKRNKLRRAGGKLTRFYAVLPRNDEQ